LTDSRVLGFVGVGRMGGPMASRLLDAGYQLVVFDTNADATAPLAESDLGCVRGAGHGGKSAVACPPFVLFE
jgi:3-hydroxyisobutyrate dehydrogenase-like beta-hydroxyacid dehydrogenase